MPNIQNASISILATSLARRKKKKEEKEEKSLQTAAKLRFLPSRSPNP